MKRNYLRQLASALCALMLALSLLPAASASYLEGAPYQIREIIGGDPDCEHDFDSMHPVADETYNCLKWYYKYWPCTKCGAKQVSYAQAPKKQHNFNPVTGICISCNTPDPDPNASYPGSNPSTPTTPTTPDTPDTPSNPSVSTKPNLPTEATSEKEYEVQQILGGDPACKHSFDSSKQTTVRATCIGYGYGFWPCRYCDAYQVCATLNPSGHRFNGDGVCIYCGASKDGGASATPGGSLDRNDDFGEYTGVISTGEMEFVRCLNVGEKETQLPLVNTRGYDIRLTSDNPSIVSVSGLTFQGKAQGSAKVRYVFTGSDGKQTKVTVYVTVTGDPAPAAGSDIKRNPSFGTYIGTNRDGVEEFKLTLAAGAKETARPMTSTQDYHVLIVPSDTKVAVWDGTAILAKGAGTATLTYKYVIDGKEQVKAIVYVTVTAGPGGDITPNLQFGTYAGKNKDGVEEFKLTLTAGAKETKLPLTSTQNYRVNTTSSDPNVIAWDGLTILAKAAGTSTLTYKYVIDGVEQTKAIVYATVVADPSAAASGSDGAAYSKRAGNLGPRPGGGYDLIWTSGHQTNVNGQIVSDTRQTKITSYDANFKETAVHPIKFELNTLKGGYWGEKYNYLIFTQNNDEQTDGKEVLRIVKFSKDWERLGAASLYGKSSNTSEAVRAANLSFAEAGDMLYVHTAHKMYASARDGLQHQAGMTFSIRQSDMTITDGRYDVANASVGYCSHSFAQDILVDQSGNIVTLDHGDAYPRAAMLFMYGTKAGGDKFTGTGTYTLLQKWSGGTGDNNTGSKTCALAETSQGYLSAYVDSGKGSGHNSTQDYYNVYLAFNAKNNFTKTQIRQVAAGSASESPSYVYLFPTGPNGGYILWFCSQKGQYNWKSDYTAYCATYSADGSVGSATKLTSSTFTGAPFNGPCYDGSKIVWTDQASEDTGMSFYVLENGKLTVTKADGALAGKAGSATTTPTTPSGGGSTPFTDVPAGTYYTDAVAWALENGVTAGTTATTFSPYATCTRGQVATFLWRAKGQPEPKTRSNPFRDVKASDYYYKAILWAYENGITAGTSATTFSPNDTCTNGHVVTFLWRSNGEPAASGTSTLAGSFPRDFYTDAVAWADTSGLLKDTGTAFDPKSQSPRANIVTYLYRDSAR